MSYQILVCKFKREFWDSVLKVVARELLFFISNITKKLKYIGAAGVAYDTQKKNRPINTLQYWKDRVRKEKAFSCQKHIAKLEFIALDIKSKKGFYLLPICLSLNRYPTFIPKAQMCLCLLPS